MAFLNNLTLWKKITLLTTIGLLCGVGVFSFLGMGAVNQATEAMLKDRLTTAQLVADYIDESLARAAGEIRRSGQAIANDRSANNFELHIRDLEETFSLLSISIHSIYIINNDGSVVWSKPEVGKGTGINFSAYPALNPSLLTDETKISNLVSDPISGDPVIILSSTIKIQGRDEKSVFAVSIDLGLSSIGGFVKPIRLGNTGYAEIVDQNGIVVARTEPGPKLAPFERGDHSSRFAALISAGRPTRGVCHTCHEPEQKVRANDVLAFVPISRANWGVVIRQSQEEALAPTRELQQNLIFFGIGMVIIALLFVWITTRDIGSRIRKLTTVAQGIAEGDFACPVTVLGKDEVGTLAVNLDEMRVKLKTSYNELEQKTKELSSLLSVSQILTSTFDLSGVFNAVVAKAVDVIPGTDGGVLLLYDRERKDISVRCALGLDNESLAQIVSDICKEYSSPPPLNTEDLLRERLLVAANNASSQSKHLINKAQNLISADVVHRNRNIGRLVLIKNRSQQLFSPSDLRLLQTIADYIAIAIERAQLTQDAEEARALHEADRLRSEFISSVSHELRTPLTLIKGYSTSLLREDTSWSMENQREFLQTIDEKTDELRDLIDKLLQSAKLEAGALKLGKEPLLMPLLAKKISEDIASRTKIHKFIYQFCSNFPVLEADTRCLEQVLRNLVENAVKYSPEGGSITISGIVDGDKAIVSVEDEGIGIPAEYHSKVFERFYRVDSLLTHGIHGIGLGLSITKGHIEAHGGELWLESKMGKGSKFYFSLPLNKSEDDE